ncbi:aminopeptidase [Sphingomonas sp. LB3N6]|uniref:aminopeptidase n=1 Tax=Sphingomonas fucosidasi TaxID=3096164 RepID=UPI002FC83B17
MDGKIWRGVQSLLDAYVRIAGGDTAVILYTSDSQRSVALVCAALEMRAIPAVRVWMAPLVDETFEVRLREALPASDAFTGRLILLSFERDTFSHTGALTRALARYPAERLRIFRSISASDSLFADALLASLDELSRRNVAILERLTRATQLRITTRGGTDLAVTLDPKHRWISNRGRARDGGTVILPAGEVATFPAEISGIHVADFAYNVNAITDDDVRLEAFPVTIEIEGGRVVAHRCDDARTMRFLDSALTTHCAYNVGELGFGTNFCIGEPIAMNSHINERRPGVHLGLGQHNQDPGVVGYQCAIHLDLIARGGIVEVDGGSDVMDLEHLVPSDLPHPESTRDEDVFSPDTLQIEDGDCCGLLSDGVLTPCPTPLVAA